jgi:hypothetical protein
VFISTIDARATDSLIVSDSDYPLGAKAIYEAGLVTLEAATLLIELGGHIASDYVS